MGFGTSLISAILGHALLLVGLRALAGAHPQASATTEVFAFQVVSARPDAVVDSAPEAPTPSPKTPPAARPVPRPRGVPRPTRTASPKPAPVADSSPTPPTEAPVDPAPGVPAPEAGPPPAPTPSPGGPVVSRGESVIAKPHYRSNPKPDYPTPSLRQREEGVVLLNVAVGSDGRSGEIALKQSSGHPLLDKAAIEAVRRWTFEPARVDGRAVPSFAVVPVRFSLSNP